MARILILSLCVWLLADGDVLARQSGGFFRIDGTQVVDANGDPAMQRGIGLGGWLMPEGYMLHFPGYGSVTRIRQRVRDLIGDTDAAEFWRLYRENYVDEKDIAALAAAGFDHVRLPIHYDVVYDLASRSFKPEGFQLLDTFIGWCRTYDLGVILDLHAAPGAQNEGEISDSDGEARLWTEPNPYQGITASIWGEMAKRFANETQIIGYDLLNEPVVTDQMVADPPQALRDLYELLVQAVRSVDTNHIVFIEGNYWATTFDKLTPPFDDKLVYAFHKYWNATDIGTIGYLLAIRDTYDVPLWLGESGENSNAWFRAVVNLMESEEIGWNWWTHKKIQSTTSAWTARIKPGYQAVLDYWSGGHPKPSALAARDGLFEMARGLDLDSTRFDPDVLAALLDADFGKTRTPYADHVIPGVVNAADYDSGLPGVSYSDTDFWAVEGSAGGGNSGRRYRNDGVDIEASTDPEGFPFNVGFMEPGEWMDYTVWVETSGTYDVDVRVASQPGGGILDLSMDFAGIGTVSVPATGGWQSWRTRTLEGIHLDTGYHLLRLEVGAQGNFNLNRLTFDLVTPDEGSGSAERPELYPVPVSGRLWIRMPPGASGPVHLKLYDVQGREALETTWDNDLALRLLSVDVEGLAAGTYVYMLQVGQDEFHGSVIVVR